MYPHFGGDHFNHLTGYKPKEYTVKLDLESTIRHICDGILEGTKRDNQALYFGFDLRVDTDQKHYNQRAVAVGIHLLRFMGSILGATDDRFIFMRFDHTCNWARISDHDSCWADSMRHYVGEIIDDIMTNKDESKYTERYKEDSLIYDRSDYRAHLLLSGCQLLDIDTIKEVQFMPNRDNLTYRRPLIPDWMLEKYLADKTVSY